MYRDKSELSIKSKREVEQTRKPSQVSRISEETLNSTSDNRIRGGSRVPTPIEFDKFLPWVCREWSVPHYVSVIRVSPEYPNNSKVQDSVILNLADQDETEEQRKNVIIKAHYDAQNQLHELSFVECSDGIPRQVIRAINLCLPFHSKLTRLNICKGCLTHYALCELTKMLPYSKITTLCLDDSVIVKGRYDMLIQEPSQLSYLSLNRCKIDDDICTKIAFNLLYGKPGANSLNVLELAFNNITDVGAQYLGDMLRTNRRLLHLNLAGNKITDNGGKALVTPLMEFSLTCDEVLEIKRRRYKFLKSRPSSKKYSDSGVTLYEASDDANKLTVHSSIASASSKFRSPLSNKSVSYAYYKCDEFLDPYKVNNLVLRNGLYFVKGNFILCSLNLAYNELHYPFLHKLDEVMTYQRSITEITPATGLMRIILDGNHMPTVCKELNRIANNLKFKIDEKQPPPIERRRQPSGSSRKSIYSIRRFSKMK